VSPADPEALPQQEADRFLAVARIVRPQGRRGEVVAEILTDFPQRFAELRQAYLENPGSQPEPVRVEGVWRHKGRVVLKFSGVDSIDQANRLRGLHVLIPREERMPLPAHQYYVWELKGCRVLTARQGVTSEVGTVTDVEPTGGVDLLHVATRGGEVLIPLAQDICRQIDPAAKTIVIDPPEDLLELNEES
jgi:16S rRNA processing protein RimM